MSWTEARRTVEMPPALPSMWRALKRGYDAEPLLLSVSFGLVRSRRCPMR